MATKSFPKKTRTAADIAARKRSDSEGIRASLVKEGRIKPVSKGKK